MIRSYIVAAMLASAYLVAVVLATAGFSTSAAAGMSQDLASCTAAEGRNSAAACTRVMDSGRLPQEQFYIGYFNRGSGYRRAGDFDKALADFRRVVKLKPAFARGYHMRGLVQADLGAREDALADLDRAIELDKGAWSTYYARASLLQAKGENDGALADLKTAGELKPSETKVQLLRALIMADMGDYAQARSEINKVISSGRDTASAYYVRAAVAFQEKRYDAASDDVEKAIARRDAFPAALTLQGRILEARGDTAEAKARYRKALQAPVDNIEARNARKIADERLKALGVDTPDVALNQRAPEPVGCKRFLPATGTIINMDCDK
jgi:tetratricopeptide (TPR) repeat protein